jgi:hypothetical protein
MNVQYSNYSFSNYSKNGTGFQVKSSQKELGVGEVISITPCSSVLFLRNNNSRPTRKNNILCFRLQHVLVFYSRAIIHSVHYLSPHHNLTTTFCHFLLLPTLSLNLTDWSLKNKYVSFVAIFYHHLCQRSSIVFNKKMSKLSLVWIY